MREQKRADSGVTPQAARLGIPHSPEHYCRSSAPNVHVQRHCTIGASAAPADSEQSAGVP